MQSAERAPTRDQSLPLVSSRARRDETFQQRSVDDRPSEGLITSTRVQPQVAEKRPLEFLLIKRSSH